MKFLTGDLHALGVAGRLPETLDHGVHRRLGCGNGLVEEFPDQRVQAGATGLGVASASIEEVVRDGEGHVRHAHRICVGEDVVNSGVAESGGQIELGGASIHGAADCLRPCGRRFAIY